MCCMPNLVSVPLFVSFVANFLSSLAFQRGRTYNLNRLSFAGLYFTSEMSTKAIKWSDWSPSLF